MAKIFYCMGHDTKSLDLTIPIMQLKNVKSSPILNNSSHETFKNSFHRQSISPYDMYTDLHV